MSLFTDFFDGIASGFVPASEKAPADSACDVVERCCQQLGWSIDERLNANEMCLHFNDPIIGIRKVMLSIGDRGATLDFTVFSAVDIPAKQVPTAALGYLLARNTEPFVAWQMYVVNSEKPAFTLHYRTLVCGLYPAFFKMLCDTLIKEASEFDARMAKAGLLR